MKFFFQVQQFIFFTLQHLADRNTSPAGNNISNIFSVYLLLNHGFIALHITQLLLSIFYFFIQSLKFTITDFGYFTIIAFTFGFFCFEFKILYLNLVLLDFIHQRFLTLPFSFKGLFLFFELGKFLTDNFQFRFIVFTFDSFTLNFQLLDFTGNLIQFFRNGIYFHTQFGCGFVHQVNGFIRQETVGDVTATQFDGCNDCVVFDTYVMMVLVTFFQSTKDGNGTQVIRFVHLHDLETTLQCFILFEVFLIFVEGCCSDGT